jgi:hypothetical protein
LLTWEYADDPLRKTGPGLPGPTRLAKLPETWSPTWRTDQRVNADVAADKHYTVMEIGNIDTNGGYVRCGVLSADVLTGVSIGAAH